LTVPPPPTSPERRLPLRQLPSERSFSASPQNADLVRNDRVFPLLKASSNETPNLRVQKVKDAFCHFAGDVFCLFASNSADLTACPKAESASRKIFFCRFDKLHGNAVTDAS
jgi:hypothetical protein